MPCSRQRIGDYHKPCNVGMVPIFCVINYK
nr:MAG TPA: hypothetical protein [Caudoviricetes sp.]